MLEVGLGGRLDATNVVDAPVAVVTGVALDHEAILGGTLDGDRAREGRHLQARASASSIGASGEPEAVPVLVEHARAAGVAHVRVIDDAAIAPSRRSRWSAHTSARNAAAALAAIELEALGAARATARRSQAVTSTRAASSSRAT